jgi:DNA-binding SARP family transcriptional activator
MHAMRLRVLGPVELSAANGPIYLARRQQRLILGILGVEANRVMPSEQLIDLVWGGRPPGKARGVIQNRVYEIRAALSGHVVGEQGIVTRANGYMLAIEPELVDVHEFRMLVERARDAGDREQIRAMLRQALQLWRGPMLGGWLPTNSHATLCGSTEALRLTVAEELYQVELELGHHQVAVDELTHLAIANPSRERLTALAMSTLHHTGRTAEALQLFERCRRWLSDELGVDPGVELLELHLEILRGEGEAAEPYAATRDRHTVRANQPAAPHDRSAAVRFAIEVPHLLPVDIPDFTGRAAEVAWLREVLTEKAPDARLAIVSGPGGVGKTALTVHVAHQLRVQFLHGQLYVDLHGTDQQESLNPTDVLARFLRALGVDSPLPDTLDERAELYRHLMDGRKILIVLDNARGAEQVRPLIPGSATCAVVITARTRLAATIGGKTIDLSVLTEEQAIDLIARITDEQRARSQPHAVADLVKLCGGLPLAVRIVSARLAAKPHWSVQNLVDRLADERRRLDQLYYGDLDVRASIALSYADIITDARLLLCRLGDLDLPVVNVWTSAALLDLHPVEAEEVLEKLHDAQLLIVAGREAGGYSRYRLHDLVRLFAKERAETDDTPTGREAARTRAFGAWLYLTETAYGKVYGNGSENIRSPAPRHVVDQELAEILTTDPLSWFETERHTITAIIHQAAKDGQSSACWGLACSSFSLFEMGRHFDDCREILDTAIQVATDADDRVGRGAVLLRLGTLSADRNDHERAISQYQQAATLLDQAGEAHGHALAGLQVAMMYRQQGFHDQALGQFEQALAGLRNAGDSGAEAFALRNIAQAQLAAGNSKAADAHLERALERARAGRSRRREAQVLFYKGMLRLDQGRHQDAEKTMIEVLALTRGLGDRPGQILAQRGLALCYERNGDRDRAESTLLAALQLAHQPTPTLLEELIRAELDRLAVGHQADPQ